MSFETVTIGPCTLIYALFLKATGEIRYVGKTVQSLRRRLKAHCNWSDKDYLPVKRWARKHGGELGIGIRLLATVQPDADWRHAESWWIGYFRERGERLLNLTNGGEGGHGHKHSRESVARRAMKLRTGRTERCLCCGEPVYRTVRDQRDGTSVFCGRECYADYQRGKSRPFASTVRERGVVAAATEKRARTQCKRGHKLCGENVYIASGGRRVCKECRKIHKADSRKRRQHAC